MILENKICFTCKEIKPIADFCKNKAKSNGYYGSCKKCVFLKKKNVIEKQDKTLVYLQENLKFEVFKPIFHKNILTNFKISNCGRILNTVTNLFVKITTSGDYPIASLYLGKNKRFSIRLHLLVGLYFVNNPDNLPMLNHEDGNKYNPHFSNLKWTTSKLNRKHAIDTGLVTFIKGEGHPLAKLVLNLETGIFYSTLTEACETIGTKTQNVSAMLKGKCKNKTSLSYV